MFDNANLRLVFGSSVCRDVVVSRALAPADARPT